MTLPTWRDWLFSAKTFAASMLALFLALSFDLPRPYWAMAAVYVVSTRLLAQPVPAASIELSVRSLGLVLR